MLVRVLEMPPLPLGLIRKVYAPLTNVGSPSDVRACALKLRATGVSDATAVTIVAEIVDAAFRAARGLEDRAGLQHAYDVVIALTSCVESLCAAASDAALQPVIALALDANGACEHVYSVFVLCGKFFGPQMEHLVSTAARAYTFLLSVGVANAMPFLDGKGLEEYLEGEKTKLASPDDVQNLLDCIVNKRRERGGSLPSARIDVGELTRKWREADADNSGTIEWEELQRTYRRLFPAVGSGESITPTVAKLLLRGFSTAVETDFGNTHLNVTDFTELVRAQGQRFGAHARVRALLIAPLPHHPTAHRRSRPWKRGTSTTATRRARAR